MSVANSDLVVYAAANMPEDDSSTVGGAIDKTKKVVFTDLSSSDTVDMVSDNAGDTDQVYRVEGFSTAGTRIQEDFNIAGLSLVTGATTFERINKVSRLSGSALAGTITLTKHTGGATLITLEGAADAGASVEIVEVRKLFFDAASDPSASRTFWEKVFFRNNNATTTLIDGTVNALDGPAYASSPTPTTVDATSAAGQKVLNVASTTGFTSGMSVFVATATARNEGCKINTVQAGVSLTMVDNLKFEHTAGQADAVAKSRITIDVEAPLDGSDTSTNRLTEPTSYAYDFSLADHDVANNQNHTAGAGQGTWVKMEMDAGQSPIQDEIELEERGNTT